MFGWVGQRVRVDLSRKKVINEILEKELLMKFIGGRGANEKILYDELRAKTDPLSPENILIFGTGPLTGTLAPSSGRFNVTARSPLTGLIGDSNAGGFWGPELKFAGIDQIIIYGRAQKPVYLWIEDDNIEIKDASRIWGSLVSDTDEAIKEEVDDEEAKVACIGPAGENLVSMATIMSCLYAGNGRTGMGSVMGSKNLKAIAVRGTKGVKVARPDELFEFLAEVQKQLADSEPMMSVYGTPSLNEINNVLGINAIRNSQTSVFEDIEAVSGYRIVKDFSVKSKGCWNCSLHCEHYYRVGSGKYAGIRGVGPEYTSAGGFTFRVGNNDPAAMLKAHTLVNEYGLDILSSSGSIAFAMECYQRGILTKKETDGLRLEWGNMDSVFELLRKIAYREGIGDILADDVTRAAKRIGKGAEKYAMAVKGQSMCLMDPRGLASWGLGLAVASRGADHLRGCPPAFIDPKKAEKMWKTRKAADMYSTEGKAHLVKWYEEIKALMDSLEICHFMRAHAYDSPESLARIFSIVSGLDFSPNDLMTIGERIINIERAFNVREGLTRKDDTFPDRILKEPLLTGPAKGNVVDLNPMLDEYYKLHDWDQRTGVPTKKKLEELGLEEVERDLGRIRDDLEKVV